MEFRFENPMALWGFCLVLIYLGWCLWVRTRTPDTFLWRRTLLNSLTLLFCILGIARPQGGEAMTTQISQQANLFIAIDISQSMWAEDALPSRMQLAIDFTQKLLDQLPQVKVALYPFALDGYMMMPLSTDLQAAKDLLSAMTPSIATGQGSDLGGMLTHLLEQIQKAEKTAKSRGSQWVTPQVLLVSDGESHVPVSNSVPLSFRTASIPIFTIGVGGTKPVTIPVQSRFGTRSPLRDPSEKLALTSAHPEILQKISELSEGLYYPGSFSEIPKVVSRLNQSLQLGRLSTQFKLTREFYPYCFLLSFFFLFAEFCFMRWEFAIRIFPWVMGFFLLNPLPVSANGPQENETLAVEAYNNGVEAYRKQDFKNAASELEKSILTSLDPIVRKKALFNLGNVHLKSGDLEQALQAYQQAYDTQTQDARFNQETNTRISDNLALLERIKKMQPKKSNQQRPGDGDGDDKKQGQGTDPKGPKKFEQEAMSEKMKQKVFDQISEEEREILKKLAKNRNRRSNSAPVKPW